MTLKDLARRSKLLKALFPLGQPTLIISLLITGLILGVRQLGGLQRAEIFFFDQMVNLKPDAGRDPRLLIVEITESDIQTQKQWPLSDLIIAQLLQTLQQYEPKVIGLDLYRDIPQQPGHQALIEELQAENIIVINKLGSDGNSFVPPPPNVPEQRIGFNDLVIDPDGVVRRNLMFAALGKEQLYSFALKLSLSYLATENNALKIKEDSLVLGNTTFVPLEPDSGGYQNIDALGYQILINYRSAEQVAQQVTLTQALQGQLDPSWVKDKIVLIGTTAPSGKDSFYTPYSVTKKDNPAIPGVVLHAQMTSQLLGAVLDGQSLFWFWHQWGEALWIWTWSLGGGFIAWRLRNPLSLGAAGIVLVSILWGSCLLVFIHSGWIPLVPAALSFFATSGIILTLHNAFHDSLTGLPNRALFTKQLQWAIAQTKEPVFAPAVLFVGLDRFKVINESIGHKIGDQVLMMTVNRLKDCLRPTDQVARVGGDEFAILLKEMRNVKDVTLVTERLQKELKKPLPIKEREIFTTVSIGIAFNCAQDNQQPADLLQNAHTAMLRAKLLGKDRYEFFATDMRTQAVTRFQLETDLRHAIELQEFQMYYQPIIALKTGKVAGFEALVRWQSPQRGFVSPGQFIPLAEETGLIIPLGKWILEESCRQMSEWHQQLTDDSTLMLSVNLSSKQFAQPDLVEQVEQVLQQTKLNPSSLKLEITESMVMDDVETAIALLLRLKALQIQVSMDDFGTGYSSLSNLHRFPLDTLKVDQSFVRRMEENQDEDAIVRTIVMLGHNLGMDVVAEGIETETQLAVLRDIECEYGQGYFFSKPVSNQEATELLKQAPQW